MKIELKNCDSKIILEDDSFDIPGFLEVNGESVFVLELYSAVLAFKKKYCVGLEREKLLKKLDE